MLNICFKLNDVLCKGIAVLEVAFVRPLIRLRSICSPAAVVDICFGCNGGRA